MNYAIIIVVYREMLWLNGKSPTNQDAVKSVSRVGMSWEKDDPWLFRYHLAARYLSRIGLF